MFFLCGFDPDVLFTIMTIDYLGNISFYLSKCTSRLADIKLVSSERVFGIGKISYYCLLVISQC